MSDPATIGYGPPGWCFTLVVVSSAKYALATLPMSATDRLWILEKLASAGDGSGGVTMAAIAAVEPADPIGIQIIREAFSLDSGEVPGAPEAFKVLTDSALFSRLIQLNPSLLAALDCCGHRNAA